MALNSAVCTAPDETGANLSASGEAIRVPAESPDLALRRAIALDRNNQAALVGLAAMTLDERNAVSTYVLLEEAARVGPVPPDVEALRQALFEQTRLEMEVRPYLRAIGRVPAPRAEHSRRILVATNLFPPQELGGYGRMMWEYAHGLKARGHDVHVLTADALTWAKPPAPDEAEMETGVRRKLKLFGGWKDGQTKLATAVDIAARNLENVASMGEAIRDFTPDVVLAGNLDLVGVGIVEAALTAGVPVLHAVANAMPGYGAGAQPRSPRYWMAPCSDWNGRALRDAGYAPARMETVYPGARTDRFFRLFLPETAPLRICYASLILPYKGPHVLVQALVRLHRRGIAFTAEIAGEAPEPEFLADLRDVVATAGLGDKVRFTGFLDRAGISAMFGRSNVLVFPSKFAEPFGISQLEAMAAGLAVVTSGTGGAGEIVRPEIDGLVFNPDRPDELAGQLGRLARDPSLASRLQRAGQVRAAEMSTTRALRQIEELMEEQIAARP